MGVKTKKLLGVFFLLLMILSGCGKSDFYGEYSIDGQPRYDIKIMDNGTATLNIDKMFTVQYKKKGKRLEVIQDDVYYYYVDNVTGVFFELTSNDVLIYNIVRNGDTQPIGEFLRIKGSDGKSGVPSVFWLTVKSMVYGLIISIVMFIVIRFIFKVFIR